MSLMHDIGSVVARECRALGLDAAYSPEVNLYTDPRNGRGQEAFSEEPYLTGEMGVAMTLGIQGGTDGAPCGPQCYSAQDKVTTKKKGGKRRKRGLMGVLCRLEQ